MVFFVETEITQSILHYHSSPALQEGVTLLPYSYATNLFY